MVIVVMMSGDKLPLRPDANGSVSASSLWKSPAAWQKWLAIFLRHGSYVGRYRITGSDSIAHHIEAASIPHWVGGVQRRSVTWEVGDLVLGTEVRGIKSSLVWRRVESEPAASPTSAQTAAL